MDFVNRIWTAVVSGFKYAIGQRLTWVALIANLLTWGIIVPAIPDSWSVLWVTTVFTTFVLTVIAILDVAAFREVDLFEEVQKSQSAYVDLIKAFVIGLAICVLAGSGNLIRLPGTDSGDDPNPSIVVWEPVADTTKPAADTTRLDSTATRLDSAATDTAVARR